MVNRIDYDLLQRQDSQNIFEEYLKEIDLQRNAASYNLRGVGFFQNTILVIEIVLQDFNANEEHDLEKMMLVNQGVQNLLENWLELFRLIRQFGTIEALAYNLVQLISIIKSYAIVQEDFERYLLCFVSVQWSKVDFI